MAVIVTGMDMSKCCGSCDMSGTGVCRKWMNLKGYEIGEKRAKDCPVKSVDGLIAEIYDKFMTADGNLHDKTARKCIEIIREYCGEELK